LPLIPLPNCLTFFVGDAADVVVVSKADTLFRFEPDAVDEVGGRGEYSRRLTGILWRSLLRDVDFASTLLSSVLEESETSASDIAPSPLSSSSVVVEAASARRSIVTPVSVSDAPSSPTPSATEEDADELL
jgi:hypothetical protein